MNGMKTMEVARELGMGYHQVFARFIRTGLIRPAKDASGDLWWSVEDVRRAREILEAKRREPAHVGSD